MHTKHPIEDSNRDLAAGVAIHHAKGPPTQMFHLDPATALSEVLFGLIMTLTFTLSAGLIIEDEGREGARQLLIAVIGCNIAWGIIDGALYLAGELFSRGRLLKLGQSIRSAPNRAVALEHVTTELDPLLGEVLEPSDRKQLYERIIESTEARPQSTGVRINREDWKGAFTSFWLVLLSSVPAALPFMLIDDARFALRISNGLLIGLLFFTGYWWARYTLGKPWIVGASFLSVGLVLTIAAIALGG